MQQIVALVIPFIALIFFIGVTENLEILIEKQIQTNPTIAKLIGGSFVTAQRIGFVIIFLMAYFISWLGDWRFFQYLQWFGRFDWADWGMSALAIAAGSNQLQKNFDFINKIPAVIGGISTFIGKKPKVEESPIENKLPPNDDGSVG